MTINSRQENDTADKKFVGFPGHRQVCDTSTYHDTSSQS